MEDLACYLLLKGKFGNPSCEKLRDIHLDSADFRVFTPFPPQQKKPGPLITRLFACLYNKPELHMLYSEL